MASVCLWLAGCAATPSATAPSAASRAAEPSARRQTVAVFPFTNDGIGGNERLDFLREWLADTLAAKLQTSGELRVVERRELVRILAEQKLGASALASKESRLELGKIAGAQTLVVGGFAPIGDVLQITARLVDTESGVVLKSAAVRGDVASARALGDELAQRLAKDLGITIARATQAAGIAGEHALAEAELFYRGMQLEKSGKTDEAIDAYRRALELDPNDREARERLRKLLGASR